MGSGFSCPINGVNNNIPTGYQDLDNRYLLSQPVTSICAYPQNGTTITLDFHDDVPMTVGVGEIFSDAGRGFVSVNGYTGAPNLMQVWRWQGSFWEKIFESSTISNINFQYNELNTIYITIGEVGQMSTVQPDVYISGFTPKTTPTPIMSVNNDLFSTTTETWYTFNSPSNIFNFAIIHYFLYTGSDHQFELICAPNDTTTKNIIRIATPRSINGTDTKVGGTALVPLDVNDAFSRGFSYKWTGDFAAMSFSNSTDSLLHPSKTWARILGWM